ncbi:SRR1-like protein isoform X1 [Danaus plexippus]|uniref:SRR1-like protein isoform X1 n=1 Tax=Danaus plexippus TaxID=13037 RepID=UPI002AB2F4E0|nr:SRR1-like protein isoform X1 [Danaus plexippus]
MSKLEFDSDGFQIVKSKNSVKSKVIVPTKDFKKQDIKIDIEKSRRRIEIAIEELKESQYLKDVVQKVSEIAGDKNIVEIVCFGLGHISECNISRYQLALLLCLKQKFNPHDVFVHDPIFYTNECTLLNKLSLSVIVENTEGNYIISKKGVTLAYFPHCPKQLTNNFLWSNWGLNLDHCILICNSFSSLIDNQPSRVLKQIVPCITKIHPLSLEVTLENSFVYKDIFNDTSIHYFPKEKLESVPSNFWIANDKPDYKNIEEFITSEMIDKLTL